MQYKALFTRHNSLASSQLYGGMMSLILYHVNQALWDVNCYKIVDVQKLKLFVQTYSWVQYLLQDKCI